MSALEERTLRWLLCLYPRWFRDECGDDLIQTYREVLRSGRAAGTGRIALWAWLVKDAVVTGLKARFGSGAERRSKGTFEMGGATLLGEIVRESRFAARALARSPLFTAAAVATLGLGIGATVSIFT